jgi:hypothetical protein
MKHFGKKKKNIVITPLLKQNKTKTRKKVT